MLKKSFFSKKKKKQKNKENGKEVYLLNKDLRFELVRLIWFDYEIVELSSKM